MEASTLASITSSTVSTSTSSNNVSEVSQENFLNLLVTQLTNQDPLNPVTNEDFISQLAQLQSLEEQKKIAVTMQSIADGQKFSSASGLIGRIVSGSIFNGEEVIQIRGKVVSVTQTDGKVTINVKENSTGHIMELQLDEISEIMEAALIPPPLSPEEEE